MDKKSDHNHFRDNFEALSVNKVLPHYNREHGTSFEVIKKRESPDFHCQDPNTGEDLFVEVTNATNQQRDPVIYRKLLNGTYHGGGVEIAPSFEEDLESYKQNIRKKFSVSYGQNCALVVYQMGLPWDWDDVPEWSNPQHRLSRLRDEVDYSESPFEHGVWLLTWEQVYRLDKKT